MAKSGGRACHFLPASARLYWSRGIRPMPCALSVTVVEISTTVRGIPSEVLLGKRDGLPKRCVANTDSLVTIPKTWLETRIAPLRGEKIAALDAALRFSLALTHVAKARPG